MEEPLDELLRRLGRLPQTVTRHAIPEGQGEERASRLIRLLP